MNEEAISYIMQKMSNCLDNSQMIRLEKTLEEDGKIFGLYILHPNNVGRCGHICNASYAVSSDARGRHIGNYSWRLPDEGRAL